MGKHIADGPRHADGGDARVTHYAEIERRSGEGPGKAAKALHRQEKTRDTEGRVKRFLDIDRRRDD